MMHTTALLLTGFLAGIMVANFYWMPRIFKEWRKQIELLEDHRKDLEYYSAKFQELEGERLR